MKNNNKDTTSSQKFVSVGKILNFHGIKGEARVGFTQKNKDIFSKLKQVFVIRYSKMEFLDIESIRFHKNFAIVKFKNINDVNKILEYKGLNLNINKEQFIGSLEKDEYLVSDLIGMKAYDTIGTFLGIIESVSDNNASSLLSIRSSSDNKLYFVPFVKELVPSVNMENGQVIINNIEGLIN